MQDQAITALRSVELGLPDPQAAADFYTRIWGLEPAGESDGKIFLAATGGDAVVLELSQDSRPRLRKTTFRTASLAALTTLHERIAALGLPVLREIGPAAGPFGGSRFVFRAPGGAVIELVHGDQKRPARIARGRPSRLSHVNLNTPDVDGLAAFFCDTLGFQLTDRSKTMGFVRCNADHHAVVLAEAPVNGLNHIAFLMPDWESVMLGSGRMRDAGFPIGWGIGRHGPGDNVFAYFVDPMGVVIEYTAEVLQVDDSYRVGGPQDWAWPPGRSDHWGIAPPKTEACKAAQLAWTFDD